MRAGFVGWLVAAVLLVAFGSLTYSHNLLKAERDALQNDLAAANGRLKAAREGAQRAAQEAQRARTELEGVLNEVPVWRDGGVPEPVRDSLCASLRCAEPRTVPAPAG